MIQKSFLSLFSLLDPIAEKKNCLFLIKVWIPPTIISASAPGWLGALSPESAREAQRWRGGGGFIDFQKFIWTSQRSSSHISLDVQRRTEKPVDNNPLIFLETRWQQLVLRTSASFFALTVTLNTQVATSTMCLCNSKRDIQNISDISSIFVGPFR